VLPDLLLPSIRWKCVFVVTLRLGLCCDFRNLAPWLGCEVSRFVYRSAPISQRMKPAIRDSAFSLERPQEIDDFLLLLSAQLVEMFDDLICLAAMAPVISDCVY